MGLCAPTGPAVHFQPEDQGPPLKTAKFRFWREKKGGLKKGEKEVSQSFTANSTRGAEGPQHHLWGQHSGNQSCACGTGIHNREVGTGEASWLRGEMVPFCSTHQHIHNVSTGLFLKGKPRCSMTQLPSMPDPDMTTAHPFIFCCHRDKTLSISYLRRKLKYSSCLACVVCLMMVWKVRRSRAQMWDCDTAGWERLHFNQEGQAVLGITHDRLHQGSPCESFALEHT